MSNIIQQYKSLADKLKLEKVYSQGSMQMDTEFFDFSQAEALRQFITDKQPEQGWVCYQSAVESFNSKQWTVTTDSGNILNAELVLSDKSSLHIRLAEAGWQATTLTDAEGDELIQASQFLQTDDSDAEPTNNQENYLNYKVLWTKQQGSGYQPSAYRFVGFNQGKGEKQ